MKWAKTVAHNAFCYLLVPYFAFFAARYISPDAKLVGPFLLVSPLIAFAIAMWVLTLRRKDDKQCWKPWIDLELTKRAQELSGNDQIEVHLYSESNEPFFSRVIGANIYVNDPKFRKLSQAAKDFALASRIAELERIGANKIKVVLWPALTLAAGIVASLNLWSILAFHAAGAVWLVSSPKRLVRKHTLANDRRAFQLTGNLDGAVSYIRREDDLQKSGGFIPTADERIAALQAV